ncbi:MAG: sugar O-acetyltransferase [Pseudomonadota bacterium]
MTEHEKMLSGAPFNSRDPELLARLTQARDLLSTYNATGAGEIDMRRTVLTRLLGHCGPGVWVEPPFQCDYGEQISLGDRVFINFNCVILDANRVEIGADTVVGPGVHIYATEHPLAARDRVIRNEQQAGYAVTSRPVTIGARCWIGGGAIVTAGVTIGDGTTIGAGSVVTESVPAAVLAAGNPCRVIRSL